MQTTTFGLGVLLRRVKEKSLTIPPFQRTFIWREGQVKSLIDSISRSYPIGSLLLLDKKPQLELASRSVEAEIRADFDSTDLLMGDCEEVTADTEAYILDGQQRTTSIARVFMNADPTKVFYFDLKLMWYTHKDEETSWIRTRRRGKTESKRRDRNRLVRADVCLNQQESDVFVSEYMEDSDDFPEFREDRRSARKAAAHVKGIFETIRNYKIPVITIERDSGLESICRVFETINSTGTRLRTFDLAVARYFPNPNLRQLWEEALEEHRILKDFSVDGERVLQVLALIDSTRRNRYPNTARSTLLSLDRPFISSNWNRSIVALAETYKWARDLGARPETLPNHNVLAAVAAIRCIRTGLDNGDLWPDHEFIKRWYFSKVLQAGSSPASNYVLAQDFQALRSYVDKGVLPKVAEVALNPEIVLRLRPQDVRYRALQCIFSMTIRLDLWTGAMLRGDSELHDHHIFPRNAHRKFDLPKNLLDGICNRVYILGSSNLTIGEGYPSDYFAHLADVSREQGTVDGLERRIRDCMIPGTPKDPQWTERFSIDGFRAFCEDRARLIVARVREVIGDSLKDTAPTEDELADED